MRYKPATKAATPIKATANGGRSAMLFD
jgi:hypothetical protein